MQEVFSKIIEELEENQTIVFNLGGGKPKQSIDLERAIEIVKQEAKQYNSGHFGCNTNGEHEKCNGCGLTDCKNRNKIWFGVGDDNNGWIPCSERLPEPIRPVLVTLRNWMNDKYIVRVGRFHTDHWKTDEGIVENSVVVAWQTLPQPYQPKGE